MLSEAADTKILRSASASRARMLAALSGLCIADDVVKVLNISRSTLRGLLSSGELEPLTKIGPLMVFMRDEVDALKTRRDQWRLGKRQS